MTDDPTTVFGDFEAEDAWDASDDHAAHVHNLVERIHDLADRLGTDGDVDEAAADVLEVLEADALAADRARGAGEVDHRHVAGILEDLDAIRSGGVA